MTLMGIKEETRNSICRKGTSPQEDRTKKNGEEKGKRDA